MAKPKRLMSERMEALLDSPSSQLAKSMRAMDIVRTIEAPGIGEALRGQTEALSSIVDGDLGGGSALKALASSIAPAALADGGLGRTLEQISASVAPALASLPADRFVSIMEHSAFLGRTLSAPDTHRLTALLDIHETIGSRTFPTSWDFAVADLSRLPVTAILPDMPDRSLAGFAHLVRLGKAQRFTEPFSPSVRDLVDEELGEAAPTDDASRDGQVDEAPSEEVSAEAAGFNPNLVAFEEGTQHIVVEAAGFGFASLSGRTVSVEGAAPVTLAFDGFSWELLSLLEFELRRFVGTTMSTCHGSDWVARRMPPPMRERWTERGDDAVRAGEPRLAPIFYADLTDLKTIIVGRANWRDGFAAAFRNKEAVITAFDRLNPLRNARAHGRPLSKIGQVTLAVEAHGLLRAMGVPLS